MVNVGQRDESGGGQVAQALLAQRRQHVAAVELAGRVVGLEPVEGADRMTEAVTLFALLELYKIGEATWEQRDAFGPIAVRASTAPARAVA